MRMVQTMEKDKVAERERLFIDLYKSTFPLVAKYVAGKSGSFEEAKDLFQDALIIWYEKNQTGNMVLHHSRKAYIMGIVRHLWSRRYKENTQQVQLDETIPDITLTGPPPNTATEKLLTLLQTTGAKCMELLRAFYYDKLPMDKLANRFGFSGVRSATVQKYKCLEKVRDTIKEKSLTYEDFLE
jgi:DNA-directed RNA polymerase specialized sigma24 family protein